MIFLVSARQSMSQQYQVEANSIEHVKELMEEPMILRGRVTEVGEPEFMSIDHITIRDEKRQLLGLMDYTRKPQKLQSFTTEPISRSHQVTPKTSRAVKLQYRRNTIWVFLNSKDELRHIKSGGDMIRITDSFTPAEKISLRKMALRKLEKESAKRG